MATKQDLTGALHSMFDTLLRRADPMQSSEIQGRMFQVALRGSHVANQLHWWHESPDEDDAYAPLVSELDAATRAYALVDLADENAVRAALDRADHAIRNVESLMG